MFLGKLYRKKRNLPLPQLHPSKKARRDMSWSRPVHNASGIERNWFESSFRSHAACCGCGDFIGHINALARRYGFVPGPPPPGGPRPPPATLTSTPSPENNPRPALPWRGDGGGDAAASGRGGDGERGAAGEDYRPEDLDELFAALDEE